MSDDENWRFSIVFSWNTWNCAGFTFSPTHTHTHNHELGVWIYWLSSTWVSLSIEWTFVQKKRTKKWEQCKWCRDHYVSQRGNSIHLWLFYYKYSHRHNCRCQMWKSVQFLSFCSSLSLSASWLMCYSFSFHLFCYYFHDICCCCLFLLFIERRDGRARTLQLFWASISRMASETT